MFAVLLFFLSTSLGSAQSCVKPSQVKELQAICDEASKDSAKDEKVRCESVTKGDTITGPTLQFNALNANSKLNALLEGMDRRVLQNSLPEKCEAPCTPATRSVTVLKVKPAATNTRWLASESKDGECTAKHFNKSMISKQVFKTPKSAACKKDLQDKASNWVKDLLVHEGQADIEWNGGHHTTTMLALCPDPCSYYSDQVFDFKETEKSCEVTVTLNVLCSQPRRGLSFQAAGALNIIKSCEKPL